MTDEDWYKVLAVNLSGAFSVSPSAHPSRRSLAPVATSLPMAGAHPLASTVS
jgi:hypothetical protein